MLGNSFVGKKYKDHETYERAVNDFLEDSQLKNVKAKSTQMDIGAITADVEAAVENDPEGQEMLASLVKRLNDRSKGIAPQKSAGQPWQSGQKRTVGKPKMGRREDEGMLVMWQSWTHLSELQKSELQKQVRKVHVLHGR